MSRLNLIIAGAQRSATSSLKQALMLSPEICFLSNSKEVLSYKGEYVGFPFATPFNSYSMIGLEDGGKVSEEMTTADKPRRERWNPAKLMKPKPKYYGTKWPYFMVFPHIACNIRQHLPDARILFILRNPTDCLWSSYRKSYSGSDLLSDFGSMVDERLAAVKDNFDDSNRQRWQHMLYSDARLLHLDRGMYYSQLMNYIHLFGWSQVFVTNYQDFADQPLKTFADLMSWLNLPEPGQDGIDYSQVGQKHNSVQEHATKEISALTMPLDVRKKLDDFYYPSNSRLCELMDWDFESWTQG